MVHPAHDFDLETAQQPGQQAGGPVIQEQPWGYIITDGVAGAGFRAVSGIAGRFFGAILLMAAAGLWILPDSLYGPEFLTIKLALMVMFSVVGGYSLWAGRHTSHPGFCIDLLRSEVRIGHRDLTGKFRTRTRVAFSEVGSVFLLRSKDPTRPTRLFLRLGSFDAGVEVGSGPREALEALRARLVQDIAGQAHHSAEHKVARPRRVAA